jgi:hypothetical protein
MTLINEPTKTSPLSKGICKHIVQEFLDLYWPQLVRGEVYEIGVEDLEKLVGYAAWWSRGNGSPDEKHQVVKGWSNLRLTKDNYTPSEEKLEEIKERGATA